MRRAARLRLAVTAVVAVAGASAVAVVAAAALTGGVETLAIADDRVQDLSAEVVEPAPSPVAGSSRSSGVDPDWVLRSAERTGIPAVAVRAYADAALTLASEQPACHVGWTTLAGIATVESDHGRHGGGDVDEHGRTSVPIVGPALDGSPGLAAIPADAASTARHGDPVWDPRGRALPVHRLHVGALGHRRGRRRDRGPARPRRRRPGRCPLPLRLG